MAARIRVALIGAGRIGQVYGQVLSSGMADAELAAVADARAEAAQATAERYGAPIWSADYRQVLNHPAIDVNSGME